MPVFLIELDKKVFLANEWDKRLMYDSTINIRHNHGIRLFCAHNNLKINTNRVETSLIQIQLIPDYILPTY